MRKVLFTATVDSHILHFHIPFLKYFKENGYEVHVATNTDDEIPYCDKKHKICFERSPIKINNLKAIKELKKVVNEEKFDIIHTHTPMGSVVTRLASKKARKNGTRVIYTAHGFHFYKGASVKSWLIFYPVEKYLAKYTDTLITINKEDYELAKSKFSKRCKDINYVPGVGIDENKFNIKMSKEERIKFRKSLGLEEKDFVITCIARLDKNKNQGLLIEALNNLKDKYKDMHLLLVGPDEINGLYQEMTDAKNLNNNVHFTGYRSDIAQILSISDMYVSASFREGLPVNIMEAMYFSLPIVASNCRGNTDLVENNVNGFISSPTDALDFAKCIEKVYLKNDVFGKKSKELVKNYTLDKIMKDMEKIYNKKKRIMHLLSSNSFSGAENVACTIINNIKNDEDVVYCSPEGPIKEKLEKDNINYIPLKKLNYFQVKKAVGGYNPDILHAHDFKASLIAGLFSGKSKIISHIHKNDPNMSKLSIKSLLYKILSKRFYRIVGVSDSILHEYIFKKSIKEKYISVFNYIDKDEVLKKSKEYQIKENYDLFFFGRLSEEKNPIEFIEIVKKLNDKRIKCVMIGDGPLNKDCKELIKIYGLQSNIDMIGFKENPFPYIKNSKIGLMPSKYEGFGLTALESLILGKPVLNSGVGGLKEIFKDTDMICNNIDDYVRSCLLYKNCNKNDFSLLYSKYVDYNCWKKLLEQIYK